MRKKGSGGDPAMTTQTPAWAPGAKTCHSAQGASVAALSVPEMLMFGFFSPQIHGNVIH